MLTCVESVSAEFQSSEKLACCFTCALAKSRPSKIILDKIQVKQNHVVRLLFFAKLYGNETESALPLLNLLEILTVEDIFYLNILKFVHKWQLNQLPKQFESYFKYTSEYHSYNTRYSFRQNLHIPSCKTNVVEQTISITASKVWGRVSAAIRSLKSSMSFLKKQRITCCLISSSSVLKLNTP